MKGPKLDPPGGPLLISRGSAFLPFFPTSWCGVLVFDSVSHLLRLLARRLESFTHHLCHTIFHTQLRHTPSLSRHLSHTTLSYTPSHTGVALADIHLRFAWQAWHLVTSTIVLPGRRATYGTGRHVPSFHMASVALGDIHLRFAWQAWHLWHWAGSGGALGRARARFGRQ